MSLLYNKFKASLLNAGVVLLTDTIKVALVTASYTADPDHTFFNSGAGAANPSANEVSGTGYTAPGSRKTLASKTVSQNDTSDRGEFDAADVSWTAVNGFTAAAAIVYKDTGNDATSPLIAHINTGGFPKTVNGSDLLIQWAASGIITLT